MIPATNKFVIIRRAALLARMIHNPKSFGQNGPTIQRTIKQSLALVKADPTPHQPVMRRPSLEVDTWQ